MAPIISTWALSVAKKQVTNMDDVCKFFDFVVFYVFLHFYVLFVLCVCVSFVLL